MEPSAPDRAHTALTNEAEPETLLTGFATDYGPALPLYETLPHVKVLSTQRNTAVSTVAQARLQPGTHTHAAPTTEVGALACAAPRYDVLRTYRL